MRSKTAWREPMRMNCLRSVRKMNISSNKNIFLGLFLFVVTPCMTQIHLELHGHIKHYVHQPLYVYKCYGDTLLLSDSLVTNENGEFVFNKSSSGSGQLYKFLLKRNQFFYLLMDGSFSGGAEIQTAYHPSPYNNIATDSLVVVKSDDNKQFYRFQYLQAQLNVANYWLLQMMRLYPLPDPFHKKIENEYFARYRAMDQFVRNQLKANPQALATKVIKAYYEPVLPDWREPDPERNKIMLQHYFDFFNPADSFYLYSNILPRKTDLWYTMHSDKNQSQLWNETSLMGGSDTLLLKMKNNQQNFDFTLDYILKKLNKEHYNDAFLYLYDRYIKTEEGTCEPSTTTFNWAREKANILRNIQIGSAGPDFDIEGNMKLSSLQGDYILLLFWASWCPHCREALPDIKKETDAFNQNAGKKLITVAVSLDSSKADWQKFIQSGNYTTWFNTSELKRWEGKVPKLYNVYATPTMFLLDKDKKIIGKPEDIRQLMELLRSKSSG
jgi:thiol-disulfide isomerase/thioredoxin